MLLSLSYACSLWLLLAKGSTETCLPTKEFDFIIVGCGATGSVIANRLSENSNFNILVLETGGEPNIPIMDSPDGFPAMVSDMSKIKFTVPQKHMKGIFRILGVPIFQGVTVGGSTSINLQAFIRGSRQVFDQWKKEGNDGWGYEDLLKHFKKVEDYRIPYTYADAKYHGKGGLVTVTRPYTKSLLVDAFLSAGNELGYTVSDVDGEYQAGVFDYMPSSIRDRKRWSAYRAYVEPVRKRKNLNIQIKAHVTKIIIKNNEAKGVEYMQRGKKCSAFASKEIIVSAGALRSPQLLMLSGIGPQEHLNKLKIPVIKNLPVGQGLIDHVIYTMGFLKVNEFLPHCIGELEGLLKTTTPTPVSTPLRAVAFINSSLMTQDGWPDIELFFLIDGAPQRILSKLFSITDQILLKNGTTIVQIIPVLINPRSKGTVTLRSKNPLADPVVDPKYLSNPEDVTILKDALKYTLKIAESNAMKPFNVKALEKGIAPGCFHLKSGTDKLRECLIRNFSTSGFHFQRSCKMGNSTDKQAVVDNQLRVYGIKGLRVADASVMPIPPNGHPTATCMMIGEKVSDLIKETWK